MASANTPDAAIQHMDKLQRQIDTLENLELRMSKQLIEVQKVQEPTFSGVSIEPRSEPECASGPELEDEGEDENE